MRRTVLLNDLVTSDITYGHLYEEYKEFLEEDIGDYFGKPSELKDVPCPGCGRRLNKDVYRKMRMSFKLCSGCGTHYVSPRPGREELERFHAESKALKFWRAQSLSLPEEKLANLHGPRVNWVMELSEEFLHGSPVLADFETKYPFFIRKMLEEDIFDAIIAFKHRIYEHSGLLPASVLTSMEALHGAGGVSVMTCFESIERMFDPRDFFEIASRNCRPGALLLITTNTCSGFEYQVLGEYAPNINPINRMNLLSLEALGTMVEGAGFEIVELSTPGRLDVELVRKAASDKDADIHPFWRYIFTSRSSDTWQGLQNFLQMNRLSSHVRIAAKKKAEVIKD